MGGDYWSIFFITVDKKVIFFKDYLSIFFFFRQTWLRGPHAAPTIEGYWLIKKRIASRTCERQHSRHVFVAHVHEACMCAQGEYRAVSAHTACTLYVACTLHPIRGIHRVRGMHPVRGTLTSDHHEAACMGCVCADTLYSTCMPACMGCVSTVCVLTPYARLVGPHAWALCADTLYSPCAHIHASCTCATNTCRLC